MENNAELVRLEQFVDNLLTKYKQLQATCTTLEASIEEKEAEREKLMDTIAELRSERSLVGERVSGLIQRIEQWEVGLNDNENENFKEDEDELAGVQGKLFDSKADTVKQQ